MPPHTESPQFALARPVAKLVWDGGEDVRLPEQLGTPREDQLQGTAGEKLTEIAGRVCYDSFGKGRSSAEYHEHIIAVNHGCYDAETEVLTEEGWVPWPQVGPLARFATMNPRTLQVSYRKARRLISYEHNGRMVRVTNRQMDLLVTPDHKMWACRTTSRRGRLREEYRLERADELVGSSHAYMKASPGGISYDGTDDLAPEFFALLGFFIGDGSCGERGLRLGFNLRKERKIQWLHAVAEELGWECFESSLERWFVRCPNTDSADIFRSCYTESREKTIPSWVLTRTSQAAQRALLEGLIESDGSTSATGVCFDSTSFALIDQVQQLCLHTGLAANIGYTVDKANDPSSFGNKPLRRLHILRRTLFPEVDRPCSSIEEPQAAFVEDWGGMVYCAEVPPYHLLYVRRNGKPVWSGNSVHEHYTRTVDVRIPPELWDGGAALLMALLNRPGTWVTPVASNVWRLAVNIRAVREWDAWTEQALGGTYAHGTYARRLANDVGLRLRRVFGSVLPQIVPVEENDPDNQVSIRFETPENDHERRISLYLEMSRGASHELVRHGDFSAISQRSTRYVQESETPYVLHPLLLSYLAHQGTEHKRKRETSEYEIGRVIRDCQTFYDDAVNSLQPWLQEKGVDKLTARKQARGAARDFLGNGLFTAMIFSASVWQWKNILRQRLHPAADGTIRELAAGILRELKSSAYADCFESFDTKPSPDGIGVVLE